VFIKITTEVASKKIPTIG